MKNTHFSVTAALATASAAAALTACEGVTYDADPTEEEALETSAEGLTCGTGSGLTHWWRLNQNTVDAAGAMNGTLVAPAGAPAATWPAGRFRGALHFDGTNEVTVPAPAGGVVSNLSAYTVSLWAKPATTGEGIVYSEMEAGGSGPHMVITTNYPRTGVVYFEHRDSAGLNENYTFDTTARGTLPGLMDGGFHHIAVTRTAGNQWVLYYDGVARGTAPSNNPGATATTMVTLGAAAYGAGTFGHNYTGDLDDVRTFSRGLGPTEIVHLADDTVTGLSHDWELNENAGLVAGDALGGVNGTLNGGTSWVPGIDGKALSFNGTTGYVSFQSSRFVANEPNYTVALWVKTSTLADSTLYGEHVPNAPGAHVHINVNHVAPGDLYFEHRDDAGVYRNGVVHTRTAAHPLGVSDNAWHHIALVRSAGTSFTLYYDGVATVMAGASNPGVTTTTLAALGAMPYPAPNYLLAGSLDAVRTYRRALNGTEIAGLMSPDLCFQAP